MSLKQLAVNLSLVGAVAACVYAFLGDYLSTTPRPGVELEVPAEAQQPVIQQVTVIENQSQRHREKRVYQLEAEVGSFQIGKNGRLPFITINVFGQPVRMMVDTGSSRTGFDSQLKPQLGDTVGSTTLETFGGSLRTELFEAPELDFGGLNAKSDQAVFCHEMSEMRLRSGEDFWGIIGMDVLRHFVVQIDCDEGSLRLAKELAHTSVTGYKAVPITYERGNCPHVAVGCGSDEHRFVIDTGSFTNCIEHSAFATLVESRMIDLGPTHTSTTPVGSAVSRTGLLRSLTLGEFKHEDLLCDNGFLSILGTRYLSRYKVTMDFPNAKLYLRAGQRFAKQDPRGRSGLALIKNATGFLVYQVAPQGPAESAGIKRGDEILEIDGAPTREMDLFRIGRLLTEAPGKQLRLSLTSEGKEREALVVAEDRFGQ